jgi:Predicted endonuclease distantly related to archaeal Holliday junction resolvase and Mrr-like restriction enzymes
LTLTSTSHDRGIDVIASRDGIISRKDAIQIKRYQSDKISSPEVQRYASIPDQEDDVETIIIVTSSSFSQPAEEAADDLNVKTVDADGLYQIISENSLFSVVAPYLEAEPEAETKPDTNTGYPTETGNHNTTQSARSDLRTQYTPSTRAGFIEQSNNNFSMHQISEIREELVKFATILCLSVLLIGFIVLSVASVAIFDPSGKSSSEPTPTGMNTTEPDSEPGYTVVNSMAVYDNHKMTLVGYDIQKEGKEDYGNIRDRAVRLYLKIRYENIGEKKQTVHRVDAEYVGDDVDESRSLSGIHPEPYPSRSEISPEMTKSGWIYYGLPAGINYQLFSLFVIFNPQGKCIDETAIEYNLKIGNNTLVDGSEYRQRCEGL